MFSNVSVILLIGLLIIWILSQFLEGLIEKASAALSIEARNEIYKAEAAGHMLWRAPDIFGIALLIIGMLKAMGRLGGLGGPLPWGIPAMATGFLIVCGANIFRAWQRKKNYARFAPDSDASKKAANAAIILTLAEVLLAATTLYFTGDKFAALVTGKKAPPVPGAVQVTPNAPLPTTPSPNSLWVDQATAISLLKGRGADYLEGLVKRKDVRSNTVDGKTLYRRDDIETMGEFPTYEELGLKKPAPDQK